MKIDHSHLEEILMMHMQRVWLYPAEFYHNIMPAREEIVHCGENPNKINLDTCQLNLSMLLICQTCLHSPLPQRA